MVIYFNMATLIGQFVNLEKKRGQDRNPAPFYNPISYEKRRYYVLNLLTL